MDKSKELVEPRNVSMYAVHWATVQAYSKDQGYGSTSAGLRRIVDEWVELKKAAVTREALYYELEGRFAELFVAATNALEADGDGYDVRGRLEATLQRVAPRRAIPHAGVPAGLMKGVGGE